MVHTRYCGTHVWVKVEGTMGLRECKMRMVDMIGDQKPSVWEYSIYWNPVWTGTGTDMGSNSIIFIGSAGDT